MAKRGKLLAFTCVLTLLLFSGYAASPIVTAWNIREAIRNGDTATLEAKIDWPRVKTSLKSSLKVYALGPRTASPATTQAGVTAQTPRPNLWKRMKTSYGSSVVNTMIDRMATPAALPKLFSYLQTYNKRVRRRPDEAKTYSYLERMKRTWSRIMRVEFFSPKIFVMEMRDKNAADRSYYGILQLQGLEWKLVHLEVRRIKTANPDTPGSQRSFKPALWERLRQAALP